jgi:bis(5'-nucleosyl)-tetraphosphatase (symmetrical)
MPVYAIGDVQGMYDPLRRLVDSFNFDPTADRLWFVGDLVNRGPQSLEVVRFVRALGDAAVAVLGNHDLHALAVACGVRPPGPDGGQTLRPLLFADDAGDLFDWLGSRPLIRVEGEYVLVHAGLYPTWSVALAETLAREVETLLTGPARMTFLRRMYGDEPLRWSDDLTELPRWRLAVNAMTRMRAVTPDGDLDFSFSGPPADLPPGLIHWADFPDRPAAASTIVCGHWAAQGYALRPGMIALDTGCVWGGPLTAVRLDDRARFSVPA